MADRVDTKHPEYDSLKQQRDIYRRVLSGVKALVDNAEEDLPQLPAESDASWKDRCKTATLRNYLKKALKAMTGMVFAGEINIEALNARLKVLCENIDKEGNHLNVFAREVYESRHDGYAAVLADKPSQTARTRREERGLDLNPFLRLYNADSIWNWRYRTNTTSQAVELSMVVLREETLAPDGKYGHQVEVRYREFWLDGNNVKVQVWLQRDDDKEPLIEVPEQTLKLSAIPVEIFGTLGELPPLLDVAMLNREHFQTYSIYKSDAHKTCVPQRVIEGGTADSIPPIGGDITLCPPQSTSGAFGKAYFIEVAGSSLTVVRQILLDIKEDIAGLTNSVVSGKSTGPKVTATAEIIDNTQETAELRPMAEEFKDSLERCFGFLGEWIGLGEDQAGSIVLQTQWAMAEIKAEENADRQARSEEANIAAIAAKAGQTNG